MGKSLGNYITLPELFKEFNPMAVRYFILQFHYRSPIDFNKEGLSIAEKQFDKISETVNSIKSMTNKTKVPTGEIKTLYDKCIDAMNEDFNTPIVISEVLKLNKLFFENKEIMSQLEE
jgi:cysteinyl-tRNA synthetase